MANWANPTITTNYVTFVDEMKARDVDAIQLQLNALVAPPVGSIRLLRAPTKFQEWNGSAFVDKVLAVEGGGTGVTNLPALIPALGLGTMAVQNANNVNITGGVMSNVGITGGYLNSAGLNSCTISGGSVNSVVLAGNITYNAGYTFTINSSTVINQTLYINAAAGAYSLTINSPNHGISIKAGSIATDTLLYIINNTSAPALLVRGDLAVVVPRAFVLPVGPGMYAAP